MFVLGGDFRQTLPVVKHGSRTRIIENCLVSSLLWDLFRKVRFHTNMRVLPNEVQFSQWLLQVGSGTSPLFGNGCFGDAIELPAECVLSEDRSLVQEMFGSVAEMDTAELVNVSILTPKNDDALQVNKEVLGLLPGREFTFYSEDSVEEDGAYYPVEFLNSLTPSGMPPHKLTLKVGAVIMLMRYFNVKLGLFNGTRLIIRQMGRHAIAAEVLIGKSKGEHVIIPRILLKPSETGLPFTLCRRQFPIRLAFCMTINKSQGQTLGKVGVLLRDPCFTHGQLYTALSRVRSIRTLLVQVFSKDGKQGESNGVHFIQNPVFKQVLR